mgnify:CR=1 FL=1
MSIARRALLALALLSFAAASTAAQPKLDPLADKELPSLVALYKKLHGAPELSHYERQTAAIIAAELRAAGYEVTEKVGKYDDASLTSYGVVGVLRNGAGPVVLIRTDLDGLPVEEKTGLPYASKVRAQNPQGQEVGVMHACGHDIHMSSFVGTARLLAQLKSQWRGTVVLVGQPAEESVTGAKAMLEDGLYSRFPKPQFAIALHDSTDLPAGTVVDLFAPEMNPITGDVIGPDKNNPKGKCRIDTATTATQTGLVDPTTGLPLPGAGGILRRTART